MNPKTEFFFEKDSPWKEAYGQMRMIALDCGLSEDLKWGCPSYSYNDSNIVLIHGFKEYCAYLFFKGALLKDTHKILVRQTENVQSARQIRFTSAKQISKMKATLKAYIFQAIEIEKAGLKVEFKKTREFNMPEEFESQLKKMPALKKAFEALTPGRQRGYLLYFSSAKLAKTREDRIKKYIPQILKGKGVDD
ncbi:MAG: YdeI/OmpD-associated family protein [Bacteroidia bacterium]